MAKQAVFWLSLTVWAALYAWSFMSFATMERTGDGFTRGLNRVGSFLLWQFAAGLTAIFVWHRSRAHKDSALIRRLARLPVALFVLLVLAIAALFLYGNFFV